MRNRFVLRLLTMVVVIVLSGLSISVIKPGWISAMADMSFLGILKRGKNIRYYNQVLGTTCWSATYGGPGDETAKVIVVGKGGYLVGGLRDRTTDQMRNNGISNFWLMETDFKGKVVWEKSYTKYSFDVLSKIIATGDGGVVVAGVENKNGGYRLAMMKLTDRGRVEWEYKTPISSWGMVETLDMTSEGGVITSVTFLGNVLLVHIGNDGEMKWNLSLGEVYSHVNTVKEEKTRGFVVTGSRYKSSEGTSISDAKEDTKGSWRWTAKIGNDGSIEEKRYGDGGPEFAPEFFVEAQGGGHFSVQAEGRREDGPMDIRISKTNSSGIEEWFAEYGGESHEEPVFIKKTSDGGFIVAATTKSFGVCYEGEKVHCGNQKSAVISYQGQDTRAPNAYILKFDAGGALEWEKVIGGPNQEMIYDIVEAPGGGYLLAGSADPEDDNSDAFIAMIDSEGVCDIKLYGDESVVKSSSENARISASRMKDKDLVQPFSIAEVTDEPVPGGCWAKSFGTGYARVVLFSGGGDETLAGFIKQNLDDDGKPLPISYQIGGIDNSGRVLWKTGIDDAYVSDIAPSGDGGLLLAGSVLGGDDENDPAKRNALVFKMDRKGKIQWRKLFEGGVADSIDRAPDGNYCVMVLNNFMMWKPYVMKLNGKGKKIWRRDTNQIFSDMMGQKPAGIAAAGNDGCVIADSQDPMELNTVLFKHSSSERNEWNKTFRTDWWDFIETIVSSPDGGFTIVGKSVFFIDNATGVSPELQNTNTDAYIYHYNSSGEIVWNVTLGGSKYDGAFSVATTRDGGYIVAGVTRNLGPCFTERLDECDLRGIEFQESQYSESTNLYVIKMSGNGDVEWEKGIGGLKSERYPAVVQTSDGGYMISGNIEDVPGMNMQPFILKIDSSGKCGFNFHE